MRGRGPRALLALTALAAFAPSLVAWRLAPLAARVPRWPADSRGSLDRVSPPEAPQPVALVSVAAAPDGTLVAADWVLRHLVVFSPGAPGRWLPPEGRFHVQFDGRGRLHLLDADAGLLLRFSRLGRIEARARVAPKGAEPLFTVAPDGRVVVAAGSALRRFTADFLPDPSLGDGSHAVIAPSRVVGLAATADRIFASCRGGELLVLGERGERLFARSLAVDAGPLAVAPSGRVVMSDARASRLLVLDRDGSLLARFVAPGGSSPAVDPRGITFTADGRLAVSTPRALVLLSPVER